jgi:SAM-dependent methyltransferase
MIFWTGYGNMRFNQSVYAEFYHKQQADGGYPGKLLPFILRELDGLRSVLDIGSGTGLISIPLASAGHRVSAVEPSREMINVMNKNIPREFIPFIKVFNTPWENWKGGMHDAAISVHSLYPMPDLKKAIDLMNSSAEKKIVIIRDTEKMKTLAGVVKRKLGIFLSHDLNHEILEILDMLGVDWKLEKIYEERKHPVKSIECEADSILYQLKLDESSREDVCGIIANEIFQTEEGIFFTSVFDDNAYIF